jgi:cold-inducible RNA-binding protein
MENENNSAVASRKLYVGSLPYSWSAEQLEELFTPFGRVTSAAIVSDQATKKSKGFGFIELENEEAAKKAMEELNGREIEGRNLAVREARPHVERGGGGGGDRGGYNQQQRGYEPQNANEETDTSGRTYGNRRGWW